MSILSGLIGKIPVIGHGLNEVGKILPSAGQLVGGAALGPIGSLIGGSVDGNTTPLQKDIGAGVAATAGTMGLGSLLGGAGALTGAAGAPTSLESLLAKIPGLSGLLGSLGGVKGLVNTGLGAAEALNAANLQKQSTQYAKNAMDTANQSYDTRAPLRLAGVQGMLNPQPSTNVSGLSQIAAAGNPFAANRVGAPMPLRGNS